MASTPILKTRQICFLVSSYLLKSRQRTLATLENQSGPIAPVLKRFQHIKSFLVLNG
jgi:hypothetical protein